MSDDISTTIAQNVWIQPEYFIYMGWIENCYEHIWWLRKHTWLKECIGPNCFDSFLSRTLSQPWTSYVGKNPTSTLLALCVLCNSSYGSRLWRHRTLGVLVKQSSNTEIHISQLQIIRYRLRRMNCCMLDLQTQRLISNKNTKIDALNYPALPF